MNNKGADQTAQMRRLFWACVVCNPPPLIFSRRGPNNNGTITVALCFVSCILFLTLLAIGQQGICYAKWAKFGFKDRPEVIKLFSFSTQRSTKFILLINVKMPTIVGILTFISMINTTSERLKARHFFI